MKRYSRLTKAERNAIEAGLDKKRSVRMIAKTIGRAPSTVIHEIRTNRTIAEGDKRGLIPKKLPGDLCMRLQRSPGVCNVCTARHVRCSYRFKIEYSAVRAERLSGERRRLVRIGVDRSEASFSMALSLIRSDISRGLSPVQIATIRKEQLQVSASTIYRWVERGYLGMSNLDLRRKMGYRPRKKYTDIRPTPHGHEHSYEVFRTLPEDTQMTACEMDTVMGIKRDTKCILTLLLRPFRFQFALLLDEKTSSAVVAALDSLERHCTDSVFQRLFSVILTDNGSEFSHTHLIERPTNRRIRLYYCDIRQSQQKAMCERNHVELRKILPKGHGISFDALCSKDMATIMSHMNSQPRASLGWLSPIAMMKAALGGQIDPLLDALGVAEIPFDELDLTPGLINLEKR